MNKDIWKKADWGFFALTMVLALIGLLMVFSTSRGSVGGEDTGVTLIVKTIFFIVSGVAILFFVGSMDYFKYVEWEKILYIVMIVMLVAVLVLGREVNGAKSWFYIGGFGIQPSEFSKIFMVLCLGCYFNRHFDNMDGWKSIFKAFLYIAPPLALILLQPDLGTALVYMAIVFGMLYASQANKRYVTILLLGGIGLVVLLLFLHMTFGMPLPLSEYQINRFTVFLDPYNDGQGGGASGYNIIQALTAIGSGGFFGKGFMQGTQMAYVPEHNTDFVFAVIGEEFGFLGCAILILIFFFFLMKALSIAHDCLNHYGFIIVIGFVSMFLFHIVENVGMNLSLMPITGIPLPFISSGGSSLWTNMAACGVILSVSMRRGTSIG